MNMFETPDLGFAAYIKLKGHKLIEISIDRKRYKFVFEVDEEVIKKLKVEFVNSESYNFDSNIKVLKLMIRSEMNKKT